MKVKDLQAQLSWFDGDKDVVVMIMDQIDAMTGSFMVASVEELQAVPASGELYIGCSHYKLAFERGLIKESDCIVG